jgi:hypothetical protein
MEELRRLLIQRYRVGETTWIRKPNISKPAPKDQIAELVSRADVIINGEAA